SDADLVIEGADLRVSLGDQQDRRFRRRAPGALPGIHHARDRRLLTARKGQEAAIVERRIDDDPLGPLHAARLGMAALHQDLLLGEQCTGVGVENGGRARLQRGIEGKDQHRISLVGSAAPEPEQVSFLDRRTNTPWFCGTGTALARFARVSEVKGQTDSFPATRRRFATLSAARHSSPGPGSLGKVSLMTLWRSGSSAREAMAQVRALSKSQAVI
ncbi:hypothetical protein KXW38_009408, partial [Aspergillus fumigatus]